MKFLKAHGFYALFALVVVVALMFYSFSKMNASSSMTLITVKFETAQYGDRVIFEKVTYEGVKFLDERLRDWFHQEDTIEVSSILGKDLFTQLMNVPVPSVWIIYRMENGKKVFVVKYSIGNDGATYNHVLTVRKNGDISVVVVKKQYTMPW